MTEDRLKFLIFKPDVKTWLATSLALSKKNMQITAKVAINKIQSSNAMLQKKTRGFSRNYAEIPCLFGNIYISL